MLYISLYLLLLFGVLLNREFNFPYLAQVTSLSPLLFYDLRELGFKNFKGSYPYLLLALLPLPLLSLRTLMDLPNQLAVGLMEETFFRGFLYQRTNPILNSLLFTLPHLILRPSLMSLLTFFPSLFFYFLREKTDSLYPPIFFHALSNLIYEERVLSGLKMW